MFTDDFDLTPSLLEERRRIAAERPDYIDLSSSNPTLHGLLFPPDILAACAEPYWRGRRYAPHPHGLPAARDAIAAYYARRTPPLTVPPDNIFITASTSEAYALLFTLLARPGQSVLAPLPSYPLFAHLAAMREVRLEPYHLVQDVSGLWAIDADEIQAHYGAGARALLLISPHNPTGHVLTAPLGLTGAAGVMPIVADEVFCEFPYGIESVPPVGALMPDATVFHLNGISKMFALPDLKLGWIAVTGPRAGEYRDRLELLNDTLLSANSLIQFMLPGLFSHGSGFVRAMRARIRESIQAGLDALDTIPSIKSAAPSAGAFLFPSVVGGVDEEVLVLRLLDEGVFAHPGYFYDAGDGCRLMLSTIVEPDRMRAGIERLRRVLAQ